MLSIPGYQITEKLYESSNSLVYRGYWQVNEQPVILKMLKDAHPSPEKIAWFKREYETTKSLNLAGVVNVYSLEHDHNCWLLVLEDFSGESLARLMQSRQFTLTEFFCIAIQSVEILGQVHQQHIVHKDINPSNIILNPKTGQLKLIDFGISTVLLRENTVIRNPNQLEGTLAYLSPEQTGRMNRGIDYRTDFYSLGASFYELLTGQLPFETTDAMELVHSHIAKQPVQPHEIKQEIPLPLSKIVMKLMAKNAENRYQSTYGLKVDLEECHRQWKQMGYIDPFPLGQYDVSDRFQIPQRLYGRVQETNTLLAGFERVSQGKSEVMVVAGYSGIGKSVLVQEIHKSITRQRGHFISGKFDQYQRDIPYASLVQAFRSLIEQLLIDNEEQIAIWKEKLLAALDINGQVIIDVIPELELIIGCQTAVPELGPIETQNRFNLMFQNFIRVFAQPERPLVLFLDDLQWADRASLQLVHLLMTTGNSNYLYVIGAYRDNEVSEAHPLRLTLDEIYQAGGIINYIYLTPLKLFHIIQLLIETLNCLPEMVRELGELVLKKTEGNPFFINEFLKLLYSKELLSFDLNSRTWVWNLVKIQEQNITDNVVELMASKVQSLEIRTQQVLQIAACIGNQFNLQILASVYKSSPQVTATYLWSAITEGLILPLSDIYKLVEFDVQGLTQAVTVEYKFAHDRIQQATYSLLSEADKQNLHWQIGQTMLENTPIEIQRKMFEIVNQLNLGVQLVEQQAQQEELINLNLLVGKKAKLSAAYQTGLSYLRIGLSLLKQDSWQKQYDLTLEIHLEVAEVAYLSANYELMEKITAIVLQKAEDILDQVKIYEVNLRACTAQNKQPEAVKVGLHVLNLLGITFPEYPSQLDIVSGLEETKSILAGRNIENLIGLSAMTDVRQMAVMRVLYYLFHPTYVRSPNLFVLVVLKMVNLSLKYGNTHLSVHAYAGYGIILCGSGDIDVGYQFGQLASSLVDKLNAKKHKSAVLFFVNCFIRHWKEHLRKTLKPFLEGYQIGLETGDLQHTAFGAYSYAYLSYQAGKELTELEREMAVYSDAIAQINQKHILDLHHAYWQTVLNLTGNSEETYRLIGDKYDEEKMILLYLNTNNRNGLFELYFNKFTLCYLFQEYGQAFEYAALAEKYINSGIGTHTFPIFYYYDSLVQLAVFPNSEEQQKHIIGKVEANQEKIKKWAGYAPMNYLHKFYLVEAERARVLGKDRDAREYYDQAIALGCANEYLNDEALAYELAGKFYLTRSQNHVARHYLHDSHYAYQRWGAVAKLRDLEAQYPQFLAQASTGFLQSTLTTSTTSTGRSASSALDFNSVFKASQAISGQIVLDKLLKNLMKTVLENAGAQKGFLILHSQVKPGNEDGNWVIEAEGVVDDDDITVLQSIPVNPKESGQIPLLSTAIINYVSRTQENVALDDAAHEGQFTRDPYIVATQPKSILCTPLLHQGKLSGILYLENNLTTGAFTTERVEILRILSAQAAISIENSRLYEQLEDYSQTLEQKVGVRTQELQEKNEELGSALQELKATQAQIIAQEKLASLGALTAGIAHEIKNPLNFVNNFAELSIELTQELLEELETQKEQLDSKIRESIEEILSALSQNAKKINEHGKRADNIVRGMLMHSGGQPGARQLTDINALLAETVNLAYHGMRVKEPSFNITIETHYEHNLGKLNVVPQNISRVFLNVINNACYAAHEKKIHWTESEGEEFSPKLSVSTKDLGKKVEIRIRDNGKGIPQKVLDKIFNPFFTTKPTGQGTGLGLSISHDLIVQEHQGEIRVETEMGIYTEFIISLPKKIADSKELNK